MASGYSIAFFHIHERSPSHHDLYLWGEEDFDSILNKCIETAAQDYSKCRYIALAKPLQKDSDEVTPRQSANILLEHLNHYYNIDEFFQVSRYMLPVSPLHLIIPSTNAPHSMGSRTELRNVSQGSFGKEMFLMMRTSPITAPTHTLPPVAQHTVVLGGGNVTRVRLLIGEVTPTSSDAARLTLQDKAKKLLLMVTIELNFRRGDKNLPSGSNFQNRLVYYNSPNEAMIEQISIKNNLNSSADFSISRMVNVLMHGYIPDDGRLSEYERSFQNSKQSETIIYSDDTHVGVPDLSMANHFTFDKTNALHNQNNLQQIDTAMDGSFAAFNYDTRASEPQSNIKTVRHELGPTALKKHHPSYVFGLPVNVRSTFVPNATLARYSYSLEHQFMEVNIAPTRDVISYAPSDVTFAVNTSMFFIDGEGKECLPISHTLAEFPFIKEEALPLMTLESLELVSVRLILTPNLTQKLCFRLMHEDTIIFKEEVKTDNLKSTSRNTGIDLTRLPSSVCQASIIFPQIASPKHVQHLTWNRAGFTIVKPNYYINTRLNFVGGSTTPFDGTQLVEYLKATDSPSVFPELRLDGVNWINDHENWEFLMNPLRRHVLERHYKINGYTITTHPIAHCDGVRLQHLVHVKPPVPPRLNNMLRNFVKGAPRGLNLDNLIVVEYAHHGIDIVNKDPRGLNLSKITHGRIDLVYNEELQQLLENEQTEVKFTIMHVMANIQQSTNNVSYTTFVQ